MLSWPRCKQRSAESTQHELRIQLLDWRQADVKELRPPRCSGQTPSLARAAGVFDDWGGARFWMVVGSLASVATASDGFGGTLALDDTGCAFVAVFGPTLDVFGVALALDDPRRAPIAVFRPSFTIKKETAPRRVFHAERRRSRRGGEERRRMGRRWRGQTAAPGGRSQ